MGTLFHPNFEETWPYEDKDIVFDWVDHTLPNGETIKIPRSRPKQSSEQAPDDPKGTV